MVVSEVKVKYLMVESFMGYTEFEFVVHPYYPILIHFVSFFFKIKNFLTFKNCTIKINIIFRVKDTLEEFLDRNDLPQIQSFNEFPGDITLSKAIAAWKCVVNYREKVKQS